jgi:hypothetical protein
VTTLHTCSWQTYRPELGQPVRTSLGKPRWLLPEAASWPVCWEATPRGHYFGAPAEVFEDCYVDQLERYGTRRIAKRLAAIARETGAETLLLCCFEPLPSQCHRGTFSRWWLLRTGERISEVITETSNPRRPA